MAWTKREIEEARQQLAEIVKPGDTIYTTVRHVSRSGMSRSIDVYHLIPDEGRRVEKRWLSRMVAKACNLPFDNKREAVKMGGCGMDMGYAIMNHIGYALFPDGFECIGKDDKARSFCPSNDHSNGDRDYTPHHHKSGEYALRHEWL